ncbi:MAG: PBP1A family penicillin-binding protein [candidate division NC10 bacterium]|nr:PBP1A family penicillin-binding protein [candidate division NC10 bacterium]
MRQISWRHLVAAAAGLLLGGGVLLYATLRLPEPGVLPAGPARIYGAPLSLTPGMALTRERFLARLVPLGYRTVDALHDAGDVVVEAEEVDVFLRPFSYPDGEFPSGPVRLEFAEGQLSRIRRLPEGEDLPELRLEPELLSGASGAGLAFTRPLPLEEIPPHLTGAILAVEDRRFLSHGGLDFRAIARAAWVNLRHGELLQGGSTVTQQLAKTLYLTPHRTFWRKVREAVLALLLELKYPKEAILESYLNAVYFGQWGGVPIRGVEEASRFYYGVGVERVTLPQAALLAALIRGPNLYSPFRDPERAHERRALVLRRMREEGMITEEQEAEAGAAPLGIRAPEEAEAQAPYFVDYILRTLEEAGVVAEAAHARIFTTLDPLLQRTAAATVRRGLMRLEARYPHLKRARLEERLQGALVALDVRTGAVLAMVGGREYRESQFNRAVQARRQPGSLFKPFVYLAALTPADGRPPFTAATLVEDSPLTLLSGGKIWSPENYDGLFRGPVTVRTALEQSLNVPTVRVAEGVGLERIVEAARSAGIASPLTPVPSLALGTSEVTLLEVTAAYATLAAAGRRVTPLPVAAVVLGAEVYREALGPGPVAVSPQAAFVLTHLLRGTLERGTGAAAAALGLSRPAAGKTGTTDDFRDAWFVGYTPTIAVGVWVGFDREEPLRLGGAVAALPMWVDFLESLPAEEPADFAVPPGVLFRTVDPTTGGLATWECPVRVEEAFLEGTEPTAACPAHPGGLFRWLRRGGEETQAPQQ